MRISSRWRAVATSLLVAVFSLSGTGCYSPWKGAGTASIDDDKSYDDFISSMNFISTLNVTPNEFSLNGRKYGIREAWLEHGYTDLTPQLFGPTLATKVVRLCFTLKADDQIPFGVRDYSIDGCFDAHTRESAGRGRLVFLHTLKDQDAKSWRGKFGKANSEVVIFSRK